MLPPAELLVIVVLDLLILAGWLFALGTKAGARQHLALLAMTAGAWMLALGLALRHLRAAGNLILAEDLAAEAVRSHYSAALAIAGPASHAAIFLTLLAAVALGFQRWPTEQPLSPITHREDAEAA